jgi:glycosyltransferase involved in cell wall biosynthesis
MDSLNFPRFLIIVPAWNEQESLSSTLKILNRFKSEREESITILVVDDGSTDKTRNIAQEDADFIVSHPINLGVGAALRTGFIFADREGFDFVVQFDADGQHTSSALSSLITHRDDADMVIGSRFLNSSWNVGRTRMLGMRVLRFLVLASTGNELTDPTSGCRIMSSRLSCLFIEKMPSAYLGDTVEAIVIASKDGFSICEIPVTMHEREFGVPSQTSIKAAMHVIRVVMMTIIQNIGKRKVVLDA